MRYPLAILLCLVCGVTCAEEFEYPVGNPLVQPTKSLPNGNGYYISRRFSQPRSDGARHSGVDLANGQEGGEVRSVADGRIVLYLPEASSAGFGNVLMIRHADSSGAVYSIYAHLQNGSVSKTSGTVEGGEQIGRVDCTGATEGTSRCPSNGGVGAHLHFSIKRNSKLGCGYISVKCKSESSLAAYENPLDFIEARLPSTAGSFSFSGTVQVDRTTLDLFGADVNVGDSMIARFEVDLNSPPLGEDVTLPGASGAWKGYDLSDRGNLGLSLGNLTLECSLESIFVADNFVYAPGIPGSKDYTSPTDLWALSASCTHSGVDFQFAMFFEGRNSSVLLDASFFVPDSVGNFVPTFVARIFNAQTIAYLILASGSIDSVNN